MTPITRSMARRLRSRVAGGVAVVVVCALAGLAFPGAGAASPHPPFHRTPVLDWLADELPGADLAALQPVGRVLPPPAAPPVQWRTYHRAASAPRDGRSRSHVTRISLPPPDAASRSHTRVAP